MRIAIFLFLVLMNCSTLFAYEVKVTKLTDENFDPLPKEMDISNYHLQTYKSGPTRGDKQIATITLVFEPYEIGQDEDAVVELAKKEAVKLGANMIVYISGTVYKNTEDIASMTYRCVRTVLCDIDIKSILLGKELRESSVFYNKLMKVQDRYLTWSKVGKTPDEVLVLIGVKRKKMERHETAFYDIKTNKQIEKTELFKRWIDCYVDEIISVFKENLELYLSEYDKIIQIIKKYHPKIDVENIEFYPKPDAQKNINFQKFKDSFLQSTMISEDSIYYLFSYKITDFF